ncbi:MAG TPA: hypothetical protein VK699_18290 [Terriglobales bacterium]|jgi:hypothetical protein|nr:hypothetical protein [Terriglobales bacterium]
MNVQKQAWNKEDLARRLCHALDIGRQTVEELAHKGYTDSQEPGNNLRPEKLISETAFLLLAASTAADISDVRKRIKALAQLLIPHARSERMLLGMCLHPAMALDYAQAHVCLARLGYPDANFDLLLRQSMGSQARRGRERVPHRMLEQEWLTAVWENPTPGSRPYALPSASGSVLNHSMDLLNCSREDIYALTHALMYVKDFNISPRRLPRRRAEITAGATALLARCLDEQDYDTGGEVLLAWPLTGRSWSAASVFGFRVLTQVEDQAGFLPASSTRLARVEKLEGEHRKHYLLATAYHTIYVMGLLCATALQAGRTPPAQIPTNTAVPGGAKMILRFLDTDQRSVHWRDELEKLTEPERDAIAGLLLNIAFRRKITSGQFGALRELLEAAHALGLSGMPAASQTAEMLERLATFAEIKQTQVEKVCKANDSKEVLSTRYSVLSCSESHQ